MSDYQRTDMASDSLPMHYHMYHLNAVGQRTHIHVVEFHSFNLTSQVTTILLMAPITITLCEDMDINPVPILMAIVVHGMKLEIRRFSHGFI